MDETLSSEMDNAEPGSVPLSQRTHWQMQISGTWVSVAAGSLTERPLKRNLLVLSV